MLRASILLSMLLALVAPALAEDARLYRLVDGDSMWLVIRSLRVEVRLAGVDCPEYNQPGGDEAKAFAQEWFDRAGGRVDVEIRAEQRYDRYNRLVVWVWRPSDGHLLNEDLVRAGLAKLAWIKPGDQYWGRLNQPPARYDAKPR